jgi:hypothetical protein
MLQKVYGYVSGLYQSEQRLSRSMNEMIEELEEFEVRSMM